MPCASRRRGRGRGRRRRRRVSVSPHPFDIFYANFEIVNLFAFKIYHSVRALMYTQTLAILLN
jgi:hypothetical protein